MKLSDIRGKDTRELQLDLQSLNKELFELRFKAATESIPSPARFKVIRRTIARIHTVIGERERSEAKQDA